MHCPDGFCVGYYKQGNLGEWSTAKEKEEASREFLLDTTVIATWGSKCIDLYQVCLHLSREIPCVYCFLEY